MNGIKNMRFVIMSLFLTYYAISSAAQAVASDRHVAEIVYLLGPARPLPEHVKNVAVIDSGVASDETERRDARERKWSTIAADILEAMLQSDGNGSNGHGLKVVDRRATRQILAEKDMQLVGIVEGDPATAAGQLLSVQGLVMSRIKIHVDMQRTTKEKIDWGGFLGVGGMRSQPQRRPRGPVPPPGPRGRRANPYRQPYRDSGGPSLPKKQVEEICRSLTLQCSFTLVDASTGEAILKHSTPVIQKRDTARPKFMFGSSVDEAELDPVDHFIGELVEQAAAEFVGMIVPTPVSVRYELEAPGKEGAEGIRLLRADDFDGAMRVFESAAAGAKKRGDRYVFMMGVACELAGRPDQALEHYRRAAAMPDVKDEHMSEYLAAKDRLTGWLPRMLVDESGRPIRPAVASAEGPSVRRSGSRSDGRDREKNDDDDDGGDDEKRNTRGRDDEDDD